MIVKNHQIPPRILAEVAFTNKKHRKNHVRNVLYCIMYQWCIEEGGLQVQTPSFSPYCVTGVGWYYFKMGCRTENFGTT